MARLLAAALLLALAAVTSACHTPYESGLSQFAEGHFDKAEHSVREALRERPDDPALHLLLARILTAQERYRAAQPHAELAFQAGQDVPHAGRTLGKIHWELGRPIAAVDAWRAARKADPNSVSDTDFKRALEAAINTAMTLQHFQKGLELRHELAAIDPKAPEVSKNALRVNREMLAREDVRQGQYEEAVDLYRALQKDFPDKPSYSMSIGRLFMELERPDKAIAAFEKYVALADPAERVDRRLEVARRAERMGSPKVAMHFYVSARDAMGGSPTFRRAKLNLTLAGLYFTAGDDAKGKKQIERYLDDMTQLRGLPLSAEVYITAANTASDKKQDTYALKLLERGLDKAPPSWSIAYRLASLYARRAQSAEVERVLDTYVKRAHSTADAQVQVAHWALNRRNYDLAQHFFEKAVETKDVDSSVWLELARVYSSVGQIDKLKYALRTYLNKYDHSRYDLLDVAAMYQKHRLYEDAEKALLKAHKSDPKSLVVVDRLADLYSDWGKPGKVQAYYERWVKARGNKSDDYQLIGERFVRRGRPNEALPYLRKAAKGGTHHAWLQMADIYSRQRRDIDMKRALERYLAETPKSASTLRAVLSRYRTAGMDNEAIGVLEQLIDLEPGVLSHYQRLSNLYFEQGRQRDAVRLWTRFLDQSPRPIDTLQTIARWFQRRGHPEWVLTLYRQLLAKGNADPRLYRLVGDTYMSLAQRYRQYQPSSAHSLSLSVPRKQARHFYELYLDKAHPSRSELLDFADSMRRQKMWEIGARVYKKLADGEAGGSQMWLSYSQVLLHLGEVDTAQTTLARYYKARGENVEDARVVAAALFDARQYAAAEPYFQKMFDAKRPNYVLGAFRRLAEIYRAEAQPDQIRKLVEHYLQRAQNPTKARQEVLAVLQDAGLYDEAAQQIQRIRSFQGDVMGSYLAENLFRAGKDAQAEAAFDAYASKNAYPGDAWVTVGDFYADHGKPALARKAYQRSVAAAPDNAHTHQALGAFLLYQGDIENGQKELALARKKAPQVRREDIYRTEVETLVDIGRYDLARAAAEKASATATSNKDYFVRVMADYDLATQTPKRAQRTLEEVKKSPMALRDKIDLLARHGFRKQAVKVLEDELASGDYYTASQILREQSELVTTLGGFDALEAAIKPLLQRQDEGATVRAQIGEFLVGQGQYQRAIPYLRAAIAQGQVTFRESLAHAYAALGYDKEALRVYQKALETTSDANLDNALARIGVHYELEGHTNQFLRLLRVLMSDHRYTAHAAPLLAGLLAGAGRIDDASAVITEVTSRTETAGEGEAPSEVSLAANDDERVDAVVRTLKAVAAQGYVDEARGLLGRLPASLRNNNSVQDLQLTLAAASSSDTAAKVARQAVADFGVSEQDNDHRLQVASLLLRHGRYKLADDIARKGLDNPDYDVHSKTLGFLLANARAADDDKRIDQLSDEFVAKTQDKVSAHSELAERLRRLGLDQRALAQANDVVGAVPVEKHIVDALLTAQAAGDRKAMAKLTHRLLRVGKHPMNYLGSMVKRWRDRQRPALTRPMLQSYAAVYPASLDTRMDDIELDFRAGNVQQARKQLGKLLDFVNYDAYAVQRIVARMERGGLFTEVALFVGPKLKGHALTPADHLLLGVALRKLDMVDQARAAFDAYIDASPDQALAATKVAQHMMEAGFTKDAGAYADRAVKLHPERPEPYYFRGVARLRAGEVDQASRDLDKSIGPGVNQSYGLYHAVVNALKGGQLQAVNTYAERLATMASPQEPGLPMRLLMRAYTDAGQAKKGVAYLEKRFPKITAGKGILGRDLVAQTAGLYEDAGQPERAYQLYEAAIDRMLVADPTGSQVAVYMNNLAYTYSTTNHHLDRGMDLVRRAIAAGRTRNPSYLDTLGWLYFRKGDLDRAEAHVRSALRTASGGNSELAELLDHLIAIQKAKGRSERATWLQLLRDNLD